MILPNVVEVENLTASFNGRIALDGINLHIGAERLAGLIGPNGAGKTTLLRVLLGLVKPDSGKATVFGHPPGKAHNLIGYVPQSARFDNYFPLSVADVAMMGRYSILGPGRFPGKVDKDAVQHAMERVSITHLANQRFGALSGGERQKALIARALSGNPRLLLLDEPTTGVDVVSQDSFYSLLHELRQDMKMTIVMVSHDIGVITSHVDDIICINQKVFCHGTPSDVLAGGLIGRAYGSEAEIIMHGHEVPHRLVPIHNHDKHNHHD